MAKVLLLAENWLPEIGGIENYLANIAKYLDKAGHKVSVVAPRNRQMLDEDRSYVVRRKFFSLLVRPKWVGLMFWMIGHVRRQNSDVMLCGKALFEGLIGYYCKKFLKTPYFVFTYAMEIEIWKKQIGTRRKLVKVLGAADRVFYINEQTKESLLELGVTEKQLVSLQPGVSDKFLRTISNVESSQIVKKYELRKPYVISVGRLIPRKGMDLLIDAFSQIDQTKFEDVQLIIVGDGPELPRLEQLVDKSWLDNSVIFLPDVVSGDLPALYESADVFALVPKDIEGDFEGFGIVYLEAAAQGVPTVATRSGGASEAVVDGETGLVVEAESVSEITSALERLLSDETLRKSLGKTAKEMVWNEGGWGNRIGVLEKEIDTVSGR